MIAGVLNVHKPVGLSSFDVIRRLRQVSGIRRAGHAGTLDPLASGVLLVALGQATRIISYLQDAPKVYLAGVRLGQRTDTYDSEGQVVEELALPDELDIEPFIGHVQQTPPRYSAIKRQGKPLYAYARAGITVEVEPRLVHIARIDVLRWQPPDALLRIWCGKGTYVRSLANDLGGHLISLVREAIGPFRLEDALPFDQMQAWENLLVPLDAAVPLPHLVVDAAQVTRLRHGLAIDGPAGEQLALSEERQAIAIVRDGRPRIVFSVAAAPAAATCA